MRAVRIIHEPSNWALARKAAVAEVFACRALGLLALPRLKPGEGLWLLPCASIHTLGMGYDLDVLLLGRDLRVLAAAQGLKPWRLLWRPGLGVHSVLELPAGALQGLPPLLGSCLRMEPLP
jgi:uncharacterized membrane protein (UPF0127 family)